MVAICHYPWSRWERSRAKLRSSDQGWLVQGEHGFVRGAGVIDRYFHKTGVERALCGKADHWAIGLREMAAIMMMRGSVLVVAIILLGAVFVLRLAAFVGIHVVSLVHHT